MPTRIAGLLPLLVVSLIATPVHAAAQDAPALDPARVPAAGGRVQDFVPSGWRVAHQVIGDLNGDTRADRVLHIVSRGDAHYEPASVSAAPETHALLVLLTDAGGRLRRGGVAPRLLQVGVPQYGLEITVRRGVLIINQNFGMTQVTDLTHRFRWDAATRRFLLIGKDVFHYTRPQWRDDHVRRSENYLTGVRLITTEHARDERVVRTTTERQRIPRTRTPMERVDELDDS
ncbi:MAG TPA: hypothetical protein VFS20_00690 [Longimicrobium sp.]|nr:hypothetical protein [Longimicrobium sp.]